MAQETPAWPYADLDVLEGTRPPETIRPNEDSPALSQDAQSDPNPEDPTKALARARQAIRSVIEKAPTPKQVWLPSCIGLGAADIASVAHKSGPLLKGIEMVGLPGAAGLVAVSIHDLKKAETMHEKMDAGGDLTWGVQGLLYLSSSAPAVSTCALGFGLVGAATQTTVGFKRIKDGLVQQDLSKIKLGALDVGGGLLWIGWDLLAWEQPLFIGSYVLLMIGREAYASRDVVETWPRRAQTSLRNGCVEACAAAVGVMNETERVLGRAERGVKRWALRRQVLFELRHQTV
jgi:hypothetical protein